MIVLAASVLAVSLAVAMPARVAASAAGLAVPPGRLSGTLWIGQLMLGPGAAVGWQVAPWESVRALALVVNWRLDGPASLLSGRAALRPRQAVVDVVSGTLAGPDVAAAAPSLPVACDGTATTEGMRLAIAPDGRDGAGDVATAPMTCRRTDGRGTPQAVPALNARLGRTADGLAVAVTDADGTPLGEARLTDDDRVVVTLRAAGAALVPGLPSSGDSEIEMPLAVALDQAGLSHR